MKVWVLAGLFTVVTTPFAFATEDSTECQLDETRRASQEQQADATPTVARPTVAENQIQQQPQPQSPRTAAAERRRNGKRIPDAQLIGPRGAL